MTEPDKRKCEKCGWRFAVPSGGDRWKCPKCGTCDFICADDGTEAPGAPPEALATAHPRDVETNRAGMEFWDWVNGWTQKYSLNLLERVHILNQTALMHSQMFNDEELAGLFGQVRAVLLERGNAERAKESG
jgi:hypothetical protein